jgi:hypothetical protein
MTKNDFVRIADRATASILRNESNPSGGYVLDVIDLVSGGELDFTQMGIVFDMVQARLKARQHHDVA